MRRHIRNSIILLLKKMKIWGVDWLLLSVVQNQGMHQTTSDEVWISITSRIKRRMSAESWIWPIQYWDLHMSTSQKSIPLSSHECCWSRCSLTSEILQEMYNLMTTWQGADVFPNSECTMFILNWLMRKRKALTQPNSTPKTYRFSPHHHQMISECHS